MKTKFAVCILLAICSTHVFSQDEQNRIEINEWEKGGEAGSRFSQISYVEKNGDTKSFQATIADDSDGKQFIELRYYNSKINLCAYREKNEFSDTVLAINGIRVRMKVYCHIMMGVSSLRYFAVTEEGRAHIVQSFKSDEYVLVRMQGYDLNFPASGFRIAWDAYGGDTI